jgi:hypothetical protein
MTDRQYWESTKGTGVLSTADATGKVNGAIFARPHVMDDGTLAFIMADRLTRRNLKSNPNACYLFIEEGKGYRGRRVYLRAAREEQDREIIDALRRRTYAPGDEAKVGELFLVSFEVEGELPLLGAVE